MSGNRKLIDAACYAHSNLNTFASLVTILERGHVFGGNPRTNRAASKIIAIASAEQQALLREFDRASATLARSPAEGGR